MLFTAVNIYPGWDDPLLGAAVAERRAGQVFQCEARIAAQKLLRWTCGSFSATTSALTLPNVVSGLCQIRRRKAHSERPVKRGGLLVLLLNQSGRCHHDG